MRLLMLCLVCCVAGLAALPALAAEESSSLANGLGSSSSSFALGGSLVIPGSPNEGEQLRAQEEAKHASPEAEREREESEMAYSGLGSGKSEELAGRLFPRLVNAPDGGVPQLPEGERIVGFPSDFAASLVSADGKHGVIDSPAPIAVETPSGRVSVDVSPRRAGSGFEAVTPAARMHVRVGGRLSEGASLSDLGVTLTPVTESGTPLEGNGQVDGASVFYGNSEDARAGLVDVDTLVKLDTYGFREETILRSQRSPEKIFFKVGLPEGASLAQDGSGPVQVLAAGQVIATVLAPGAQDAAGTFVPVAARVVAGDTLMLTVPHPSGRYQYPIVTDPYAVDQQLITESGTESNWTEWSSPTPPPSGPFHFREFGAPGGYLEDRFEGSHGATGWWGRFEYVTQGTSRVGMFAAYVYGSVIPFQSESQYVSRMTIGSKQGVTEDERVVPGYFNEERETVCAKPCENVYGGTEGNHASYGQYFEKEGTDGFWALMDRPEVVVSQETTPQATVETTTGEATGLEPLSGAQEKALNAGGGKWVNPRTSHPVLAVEGSDTGMGIYRVEATSAQEGYEGHYSPYRSWVGPLAGCRGVQCPEKPSMLFALTDPCAEKVHCSWLPEGEDTVTAEVEDATGRWSSSWVGSVSAKVKIDEAPPHNIVLSGLPSSDEIGAAEYHLKAEATDGSEPVKSSGIKSIALLVDGRKVGEALGLCDVGPCTAHSGEWAVVGRNYAAGTHIFSVVATDNAGNVAVDEVHVTIRLANPVALGPGSVNPQSGDYTLAATDVSAGGLTVGRSYGSRNLTVGAGGPLGSQWGFSMGGQESLVKQPDGSMVLTDAAGAQTMFAANKEGGFTSPVGDSNVTLSATPCETGQSEYMLRNAARASTTCFKVPSGGSGEVWVPSIAKGAVATDTVTYAYETVEVPLSSGKKITRPTEALAPVPAGVSCSPELKAGCRALTFNYATSTTAKGEAPSEWGDVEGNLTRVYYTAYDPTSKAMKPLEVAHYLYDNHDRLRAVWDPRISPALKTIYGYDSEGHVTALTAPGRESWAFTYGTIAGGGSISRLLKVAQAQASAPLWAGESPKDTVAPTLSGSPVLGVRMAVSNGSWSGNPVAYAYQWEDCNSYGAECNPIVGATNANYTPTNSDLGHALVAQVTATNGGGSVAAASAASAIVTAVAPGAFPSFTQAVDSGNSLNAVSCVPGTTDCVVSDSLGKAFYAANVSVVSAASWSAWSGPGTSPSEALACPTTSLCLMAAGSDSGYGGNLYYASSLGGSWTQAYSPSYGVDAISCTSSSFCVDGQDGSGYFRYSTSPASTSWTLESQGLASMKGVFCLSSSFCAIADGSGGVHVATTTGQVESSSWTETNVDGTSALNGIACVSTSSCVAVDGAGNVLNLAVAGNGAATAAKHDIDGTNSLAAVTCTTSSTCVTVDNQGNIFVSINGGETWTRQYQLGDKLTSVSCASSSLCVTADTTGNVTTFDPSFMQAVDSGNSLNAVSCVPGTTDCVVSDSLGKAFYAANVSVVSAASWSAWSGPGTSPSEALACPTSSLCLMAAGSDSGYGGNLYYASSLGGSWTQAYSPSYGVDAISCTSSSFCVDGQDGSGYFRYSTSPASTSWTLESQGLASMKGVFCLSSSFCAIADGSGGVHVATTTGQVESSSWTETNFDGTSALNGIACASTSSCVAVDGAGNVLNLTIAGNGAATAAKHDIDGTNSLAAVTCTTSSTCVTVDNQGNIFVSINGGETWTRQYQLGDKLTSVSCASSSLCVTADTTGNVTTFNPNGVAHEGELRTPQPGWTVEYNVPLSGSGLPNLTNGEVEKWAQKDLPTDGTAIFSPDEPQGWPASSYKRASISYFDAQGRTVNAVSPSGGVATSEYNTNNDVVRALSSDNRASALKEAKPEEAAKLLDTQSTYNSEGTELLSTLGPRHTVKLGNGREVQARSHTVYSYDEGAPTEGGPYRLVTKVTQGAQIEGEGEQDVRTTTTSYSGQNNLGWLLRAPTSVTTDPNGLKLTHATVYDPITGNALETRQPAGASAPRYVSSFGADRGGHGKLNWPTGIAVDAKGNVWVADTYNDRVQEFSASGEYLNQFGSWGTGNGQMEYPKSVAVDGKGNVWIVDSGANRVEEFSEAGAYIAKFGSEGTGNGQFKSPEGIAVDSKGNVWIVDTGNNRVQELTESGTYVRQFGTEGTGNGQFRSPRRVRVDSKSNVWVSDGLNSRVQEFNEKGEYVSQLGSPGSGNGQLNDPQGLAFDAAGNIWVADENNSRVQEFNEKREYVRQLGSAGAGNGQLQEPEGVALDASGNVWVIDSGNSRVEEFSSAGAYTQKFGSHGTPLGALGAPKGVAVDSKGNIWAADTSNARLVEFSSAGESLASVGTEGTGAGQLKQPRGITADSKGDVWVVDQANNRIEEYDETGKYMQEFGSAGSGNGQLKEPQGISLDGAGNVWVADTANNRIEKFSATGSYLSQFGTAGTGNGQLKEPKGLTVDANGNIWVSDSGNNRVQEFSATGSYISQFGAYGSGAGQLHQPQGIAIDHAGNVWVSDQGNNRVQELTSKGQYLTQLGTAGSGNGQLAEPRGMAFDSNGDVLVADTNNNRIEKWTIATPHATQTVYYSSEANPAVPACGEHPEWANMPCQTQPAQQPNTAGVPNLPVTTVTYNMLGEPLTTTSTVGSSTRTTTMTYDEAGRTITSHVTSAVGTSLPTVTDKYDSTTGALVEQSTTVEGTPQTVTSAFNTLGQLTAYTDADGNTTKYEYEGEEHYKGEKEQDGRLKHIDDGKGTQTYAYDETTGLLKELTDTQGTNTLTFTASYDVEGNMTREGYPNGMNANYATNPAGQATGITYEKTTHCSESCVWFTDTATLSIHGQWLSQQSSLASESYTYDEAGRLTQTLENVSGEGCTTRIYAYDEETNRTSLTTRPPGIGGSCATEGGTIQAHSYDSANRLTDTGVSYNAFGETTKLPANDAGGGSELSSSFYADGQLEGQTQGAQTIGYQLDPEGRTRKTIDTGTVNSTITSHYAGPGGSPTWTIEPTSGHWTRYVQGIGGPAAIETDTQEPVLQLQDLQGNIVARASCSETATKLLSTERPTEYGVPTSAKPEKYSWLGGDHLATELPSGVVAMGARSYVPEVGRFLQTDPVPGGSANAYAYTYGNPVNESDPSGELTYGISEGGQAEAGALSEKTVSEALAREQAAREEAERKAAEAGGDPCSSVYAQGEEKGAVWRRNRRVVHHRMVLGWRTCAKRENEVPTATCQEQMVLGTGNGIYEMGRFSPLGRT